MRRERGQYQPPREPSEMQVDTKPRHPGTQLHLGTLTMRWDFPAITVSVGRGPSGISGINS